MIPKLTCRPSSQQPLAAGQTAHVDLPLSANLDKIQAAGARVANPIIEVDGVLDLRPWCPPIDDQLDIGDCVADGTTGALELLDIRDGLPFVKKSRLFVYYNARLQTQETDEDQGTFIRLAFSTLTSLGTCSEKTWPYDTTKVFIRPSWAAYQEAYKHRISSFYRIDPIDGPELVAAIKTALQAQHPVVFGMTVDRQYIATGPDGMVTMPKDKDNRPGSGGHCQICVGYNDNLKRWIVKNSWGPGWSCGGYCFVPYEYLDVSHCEDTWVPYKANEASKDVTTVTVTRL